MRRPSAALLLLIFLLIAHPALAITPVQTPAPSLQTPRPIDGAAWGGRFAAAFSGARAERFAIVDEQALYNNCFFQAVLESVISVLVHAPQGEVDRYIVEIGLNSSRLPEGEKDRLLACFENAIRSAIAASAYENSAALRVPETALAYLTHQTEMNIAGRGFTPARIYESSRLSADVGIDYDRNGAWYCILTVER